MGFMEKEITEAMQWVEIDTNSEGIIFIPGDMVPGIDEENAFAMVADFVLDVDDPMHARGLIEAAGFKTLSPQELSEIEPFHYVAY